jgi:hypothetical protein
VKLTVSLIVPSYYLIISGLCSGFPAEKRKRDSPKRAKKCTEMHGDELYIARALHVMKMGL